MPELPDIVVYIEALERYIVGQRLERILLKNPFLLRSVEPPIDACIDQKVIALRRLGKRIAIGYENDIWMVLHLMIAGRLHWYDRARSKRARPALLHLEFPNGVLTLTEAGTKRRASLHVVRGEAELAEFDRGGLEVLDHELAAFRARMQEINHTLKRALTDPTILSGIGNAYSDVIERLVIRSTYLKVDYARPRVVEPSRNMKAQDLTDTLASSASSCPGLGVLGKGIRTGRRLS